MQLVGPDERPARFLELGTRWMGQRARFSAHIVSPVKDSLVGEVLAWTPGTNGVVTAPAFHLRIPERPTAEQLTAYLNSVRDQVRGRIVLVDPIMTPAVDLNPPPRVRTTTTCAGGSVLFARIRRIGRGRRARSIGRSRAAGVQRSDHAAHR